MASNQFKELADVIQCLKILVSPPDSKPILDDNGDTHTLLENIISKNISKLASLVSESSSLQAVLSGVIESKLCHFFEQLELKEKQAADVDVCKICAELCIVLLGAIKDQVEDCKDNDDDVKLLCAKDGSRQQNTSHEPFVFSVQNSKTISTAIQFVIVLGLCPYNFPGIGLPVSHRLGPGSILLSSKYDYSTELDHVDRLKNLMLPLKLLTDFVSNDSLKDFVSKSFLSDILIGLIQIRHCCKLLAQSFSSSVQELKKCTQKQTQTISGENEPEAPQTSNIEKMKKLMKEAQVYTSVISHPFLTSSDEQECMIYLKSLIQYCNVKLDETVRKTNASLILKDVLMLSGISKSKSQSGAATPSWFKRIIAGILRDLLITPLGVQHLIMTFNEDAGSAEWQKCAAIAQIISRCPVTPGNVERFYSSVSEQLMQIISEEGKNVPPLILRTVGVTTLELNKLQPDLMCKVCFSHLLSPLRKCSQESVIETGKPGILLPEKEMTKCIHLVNKLFVLSQEPQSPLILVLAPVTGVLFSIYLATRCSVSAVKSTTLKILQTYVKQLDTDAAVQCLLDLMSSSLQEHSTYPSMHKNVSIFYGPNGGVLAKVTYEQKLSNSKTITQSMPGALVELLVSAKSDAVTSKFFMNLLQKLTEIVDEETENLSEIVLPTRIMSEEHRTEKQRKLNKKIVTVTLLASLGEKFGAQILESCNHILLFVKMTLERSLKLCESSSFAEAQTFEWETVCMALGLLTAVLGSGLEFEDTDKEVLKDVLPLLSDLSSCNIADQGIKEMAEDLKVAVATGGLLWTDLGSRTSENKDENVEKDKKKQESHKPLIEVLSTEKDSSTINDPAGANSMLRKALKEVADAMLPVKGHGLISLARMIDDREQAIGEHKELLLKVFLENLSHSDSYIYLAAVNGLSALCDLSPENVIATLVSEFKSNCLENQHSRSAETTLKVGEALVKATRRLGEMTPKYKDPLLSAILLGCRHRDTLVRSSSLSSLAEVCKLLRYSIGSVLHEVLMCCRSIMLSDPSPDPRRAAAMTLAMLLRGLGKDSLMALKEALLDIYRSLRACVEKDPDEKVQLHAQLALEELNTIMRDSLFATPQLKKTITILGYQ